MAIEPGEINVETTRLATIPKEYEKWGRITFSNDGRQVFYGAVNDGKELVVVGNEPGAAYEDISFFIGSADGRRFAFGGQIGGGKRLVVDGRENEGLSDEEVAPSFFSPDGSLVVCEVGSLKKSEWFVLVSDGEAEVYRSRVYPNTFRQPSFSPDSRVLVYELGDYAKRTVFFADMSSKAVMKEKSYAVFEQIGDISFSSDSLRAIYNVQNLSRSSGLYQG